MVFCISYTSRRLLGRASRFRNHRLGAVTNVISNLQESREIRPIQQHTGPMTELLRRLWTEDNGQDIAEYAVMLAVILVIVVGTIRLVGSNANNVFSQAASSIQ